MAGPWKVDVGNRTPRRGGIHLGPGWRVFMGRHPSDTRRIRTVTAFGQWLELTLFPTITYYRKAAGNHHAARLGVLDAFGAQFQLQDQTRPSFGRTGKFLFLPSPPVLISAHATVVE